MRYLLDTNIFVFLSTDRDMLDRNVADILLDCENVLCMSAESVKELMVAYNNKGLGSKIWSDCKDLVKSISRDYGIHVLPVDERVLLTCSRLIRNQEHKDPSDHVIISHAITLGIPLISSDTKFPFYTKQGLDLIQNKR